MWIFPIKRLQLAKSLRMDSFISIFHIYLSSTSNFNLSLFVIQFGIPNLMGINLGECNDSLTVQVTKCLTNLLHSPDGYDYSTWNYNLNLSSTRNFNLSTLFNSILYFSPGVGRYTCYRFSIYFKRLL